MINQFFAFVPSTNVVVSNVDFSAKGSQVTNLGYKRFFAFDAPKEMPKSATEIDLTEVAQKVVKVRDFVDQSFVEKTGYIDLMVNAVCSMEHMIGFGKPGTAKTSSTELFMSGFTGKPFSWPLDPSTTPNDVFGPKDPKAYADKGNWERREGYKFLGANLVFFDEIGKAPENLLAGFNTGLASRYVYNGDSRLYIPLHSCFSAANEDLSQVKVDGLYSRFALRYVVDALTEIDDMREAIGAMGNRAIMPDNLVVDLVHVGLLSAVAEYQALNAATLHPDFLEEYLLVWKTLIDKNFDIDNRVAIRAIKNVIAESMWRGEDLAKRHISIVRHMFWNSPTNDRETLTTEVLAMTNKDQALMERFKSYLQAANNGFDELGKIQGNFDTINGFSQDLIMDIARNQAQIESSIGNLVESANVEAARDIVKRLDKITVEAPKLAVKRLANQSSS